MSGTTHHPAPLDGVTVSYSTMLEEEVPAPTSRRPGLRGVLLVVLGLVALWFATLLGTTDLAAAHWLPLVTRVGPITSRPIGGMPGFGFGSNPSEQKGPIDRRSSDLNAADGGNSFSGMGPPEGGQTPGLLAAGPGALIAAMGRRKRILILMSDTGGGHRASAEAIAGAIDELFPDNVDIAIVDILTDYASFPLRNSVRDYKYLAANPWLWRFGFWFSQKQPLRCGAEAVIKGTCGGGFRQCIEDYGPDMVVSVHPLLQTVPLQVLKKMGGGVRQIPFATVVTDLGGAFPTWFHKGVDLVFVPTDKLYKMALREGLKPHQIRQHGLPVRKDFWKDARPQPVLQQKMGLEVGKKTALLVGGGDGVGGLGAVVDAVYAKLATSLPDQAQMVVICGKNEELRAQLNAKEWPGVNMQINGFTSEMSDYMGASDMIITKAGPGTIAEAAIRGLPVLLSAYLPGQEKGNIVWVESEGFGVYRSKPDAIAEETVAWLGNNEKLQQLRTNAKDAGRPLATLRIAQDLGELLFEGQVASLSKVAI